MRLGNQRSVKCLFFCLVRTWFVSFLFAVFVACTHCSQCVCHMFCVFASFCGYLCCYTVIICVFGDFSAVNCWIVFCRIRKQFSLCTQDAVKFTSITVIFFICWCFYTHFMPFLLFVLYKYRQKYKNVKLIFVFLVLFYCV